MGSTLLQYLNMYYPAIRTYGVYEHVLPCHLGLTAYTDMYCSNLKERNIFRVLVGIRTLDLMINILIKCGYANNQWLCQ